MASLGGPLDGTMAELMRVAEDAVVVGGLSLAFSYPWIALFIVVGVSLAVALTVWWVWRKVSRGLKRMLQPAPAETHPLPPTSGL